MPPTTPARASGARGSARFRLPSPDIRRRKTKKPGQFPGLSVDAVRACYFFFAAGAEEPKTDADWTKLRLNAIELAESANLLMIGSRVRDRADWMKMARAQLDAAEAVLRLAAAKKVTGLADASDKAYDTCTGCHNKYWPDRNTPR